MKSRLFLLGFFIILISCNKKENVPSKITIDLKARTDDNPFRKTLFTLRYLNTGLDEFQGIINKDSSFVMYLNTISSRDLEKAIEIGKVKKESTDSIHSKIYVLSGFNKGKRYFIIDVNENKDFSDDKLIEFSKNITDKETYRDSFNVKSLKVTKFSNDKFYKQIAHLQFLPEHNSISYIQETEKEKFKHSLQIMALEHDFLYGTFELDKVNYGVGVKEGMFGTEIIFKKSDTTFYSRNHQLFADYKLMDTLKLDDKYFRIDSLSFFPSKLIINEIRNVATLYGFRTNEISKNYEITDLQNNKSTLKELTEEKGFILLDFWGTWCEPCKELTPELVELHKKYNKHIEFVSLAFELDPKPVLEYTKNNQMNWYNGIINGKPKSGDMSSPIIGGLRIQCYPTFIIMDSNLNILYRTCGGEDNYLGLKNFLNSKFK
ncbi:TlpA family protein disulfide reductase [Yeosuana marina]|uniref:TlpA family protein disulfide reductase n=1 Tax=Yeosuana marina TaxID=1565536 RepID=UPI001421296B|nr:TlpA disulfide reductase family protein [Yeosuana marina]